MGLINFLIETVKYATDIEQNLKSKLKEIKNLENLNKYLLISQTKKEEIIKHLSQENIILKEKIMKKSEQKKIFKEMQMTKKKLSIISPDFNRMQPIQSISPGTKSKTVFIPEDTKRKTIVMFERRKCITRKYKRSK